MKKLISMVLVCLMILSMTACGKWIDNDTATNEIIEDTAPDETTASVQATEPQEKPLSCEALLTYARAWAKEKEFSSDFISDIESKPGDIANETETTFSFYSGFATAKVSEVNEIVQMVMTQSLPSKVAELNPSNTIIENEQYAYVICLELIKFCEMDKDLNWHAEQFDRAPNEGDENIILCNYRSDDWLYAIIIGEHFVSCSAARYCSRCKSNAPAVTFSSVSSICDRCNNNSGHIEEGNTSVPGNVPEENVTIQQSKTLEDVLDTSKVWKVSFTRSSDMDGAGYIGTFQYTFSKDGTCYLLMSAGFEPWGGAKGTYQINGNTISFSVLMDGSRYNYSYNFDPNTYMLTQTSGIAIYSDFTAGTKHLLEVDTSNTISRIQSLAQRFIDGIDNSGNDDENTAQQPTECSHSFTNATCSMPEYCTLCGQTKGLPLEHSYGTATCTKPATCTLCGQTSGSALGHSYSASTCTTPKTCSLCGQTNGFALGHFYSAETCTKPKTCYMCGQTSGSALGHNYSVATCTKPKTCKLCGETNGTALGHSYSEATCTERATCTQCGQTSGYASGHNYSAATCLTPQTCQNCGATRGSTAEHKWKNITETVYHEEQGHYEDVSVAKKVQKVQCYACNHKSSTLSEYYNHFDSVHGSSTHYLNVRERYEWVEDRVYVTETQWVVDKEAYTETIVVGKKCSACGEET